MKRILLVSALAVSAACLAQEKVVLPPLPSVVFRPTAVRSDEKPVVVETKREIVADNGLFQRIAAVREILASPDGYAPLNVIPIGNPAEDPAVKNKWNPAKIHADRW